MALCRVSAASPRPSLWTCSRGAARRRCSTTASSSPASASSPSPSSCSSRWSPKGAPPRVRRSSCLRVHASTSPRGSVLSTSLQTSPAQAPQFDKLRLKVTFGLTGLDPKWRLITFSLPLPLPSGLEIARCFWVASSSCSVASSFFCPGVTTTLSSNGTVRRLWLPFQGVM